MADLELDKIAWDVWVKAKADGLEDSAAVFEVAVAAFAHGQRAGPQATQFMHRVHVVWAGDATTTNDPPFEAPRIVVQLFTSAPAGPRGGRPAKLTIYDADGHETEVIQYADVYQVRRTVIQTGTE